MIRSLQSESCILLEDVIYRYKQNGSFMLNKISLIIHPGEITALLGPNGSGKTTLLDLILGWKKPISGKVSYGSQCISEIGKRDKSRLITLVPQNTPLPFAFTVLDYVLFGRAPYIPQLALPDIHEKEIAGKAISQVGLDGMEHRSITSLSSGELQLVLLARSLAQDTEIILLDEPTSNLDPGNAEKVLGILKSMKSFGKTVVFSTHSPSDAAGIADHVVMLKDGKKLIDAPTDSAMNKDTLSTIYDTEMDVIRSGNSIIIYHPQSD